MMKNVADILSSEAFINMAAKSVVSALMENEDNEQKRKRKNLHDEAAVQAFTLKQSFVDAGFSDEQAFELLLNIVSPTKR